jgi:myo-inositol-1(or 4)-monophosphatase
LNDSELRSIETVATDLALEAGGILMNFFSEPLQIQYKSDGQRSPVTDADRAANDYIERQITKKFPNHGILSEENSMITNASSDILWVIDPLDGTTNFLNQLPIFGVSIAVLEKGKPVVGAIFIPSIYSRQGTVIHARIGGGTFEDGIPLSLKTEPKTKINVLAAVPAHFWRMFKFKRGFRTHLGDLRSTGSVAYEMALVSRSVFHYAVFAGPWIWDVAAGIILIQEAGGRVLLRDRKSNKWVDFEKFNFVGSTNNSISSWRGSLILGTQGIVTTISDGIQQHRFRFRRAWRKIKRTP